MCINLFVHLLDSRQLDYKPESESELSIRLSPTWLNRLEDKYKTLFCIKICSR